MSKRNVLTNLYLPHVISNSGVCDWSFFSDNYNIKEIGHPHLLPLIDRLRGQRNKVTTQNILPFLLINYSKETI